MKSVLCFGDSNTHGSKPDKQGRYDHETRWTRQLQALLGSDYMVIEEGKGGRTTMYDDPQKPGNNGLDYFLPCIESHWPLDVIVIMLGTNDWKIRNQKTAADTAQALTTYIQTIETVTKQRSSARPQIILMNPVTIDMSAEFFNDFYNETYSATSVTHSQNSAPLIEAVARQHNTDFIDTSTIATTGEDGVHIDLASQPVIAAKLAELLQ